MGRADRQTDPDNKGLSQMTSYVSRVTGQQNSEEVFPLSTYPMNTLLQ